MNQYQIAVLVGSLRHDSINRKLANAFNTLAPEGFTFKQLQIGDLPHYNEDDEANPPESVIRLKREIAESQGLVFVTPEYNRSIPGVLKNAIDHASRPAGQSVWAGKPAGIIGASDGVVGGTALAQQHLRNILAYLNVPTMNKLETMIQIPSGYFDEAGNFTNSDSRKFLLNWMDDFAFWVKSHDR